MLLFVNFWTITGDKEIADFMEITEKETVVLWDLDENQEIFYVEEIIDLKSKPIFNAVKRIFDIVVSLVSIIKVKATTNSCYAYTYSKNCFASIFYYRYCI